MTTETIADQYVDPVSAAKWHREKAHDFKIMAYVMTATGIPASIYTAFNARNVYNNSRWYAMVAEDRKDTAGMMQRLGEQQKAAESYSVSEKLQAEARDCSFSAGLGVLLSITLAAIPLFLWRCYYKHRNKANKLLENIVHE